MYSDKNTVDFQEVFYLCFSYTERNLVFGALIENKLLLLGIFPNQMRAIFLPLLKIGKLHS